MVKRYHQDFEDGAVTMVEWEHGQYVDYHEYEKLEQEKLYLEQQNKRLREALLREFRINNMQSGMKRDHAIAEADRDLANLLKDKT